MKKQALLIFLKETLGRAVRCEGFIGLIEMNCVACSGYPDNIEPLKNEIDTIVERLVQLINAEGGNLEGV